MSDHPFAYYDPFHDKLLWAESPQYVHAQRTEGMSLKPLYLHPPRPEPARKPMTEERKLLARASLIIAKYRWNHPEDQGLHELSRQINEHLEENPQRKPMTEEDMKEAWGQPGHLSTAVLIAYTRAIEKHHGIGA